MDKIDISRQNIPHIKETLEKFYKDNNVDFDADGHTYKVNGEYYTGVTRRP